MTLEAIRYRAGSLQILNQLLLPHQSVYDEIRSVQDAYEAIKSMKVRGSFLVLHHHHHHSSSSAISTTRLSAPLSPVRYSRCACPPPQPPPLLFLSFLWWQVLCAAVAAAARVPLPSARRRAPDVGLLFLFWVHLRRPHIPHYPHTHARTHAPLPRKCTVPLCVSFHITMHERRRLDVCTQPPAHEMCPTSLTTPPLPSLRERLLMNY